MCPQPAYGTNPTHSWVCTHKKSCAYHHVFKSIESLDGVREMDATMPQGGNFHLKVGGSKSSGSDNSTDFITEKKQFYRTLPLWLTWELTSFVLKKPINTTSDGTFLSVVCGNPLLVKSCWPKVGGVTTPPPPGFTPLCRAFQRYFNKVIVLSSKRN